MSDETTILNFRHLLEEHRLQEEFFARINAHLEKAGLRLQRVPGYPQILRRTQN